MNSKMLFYVLKRVLLALLTIWIVITVTFFVMHSIPGGPFASEKAISAEAQAALEAKYGLDKPLGEQYVKNFSAESSKESVKNRDNDDSCGSKIACQDPVKSRGIKKKENKTEMNNTNLILSDESEKMKNRELLEEYFSCSLEMDLLLRLYPDDEDTIYQIVDLLVDTCATNRKLLHIAGDDKPAEVVRSRFMKLNADHIRFVLKCLAENSSPIRNMKQYLLASLYNAPTTMQLFYQNQTNHDLAMRR